MLILLVVMAAVAAVPVMAQEAAAAGSNIYDAAKGGMIAAGFAMAIGVAGGAFGQSRAIAAACEGAARNPGAAAKLQLLMLLGLAFIESLVLFLLVVVFAKIPADKLAAKLLEMAG